MAHTLYIRDGETFSEAQPQDIIDRAATLISQRFRTGAPVLDSPDRTRQYLRHQIGALPYEVFGLLLLDCRHRLIRSEILFRGTIDGAAVHPREVVRVVFETGAAAVIMYHNPQWHCRTQPGRRTPDASPTRGPAAHRRTRPRSPDHRGHEGVFIRRDRALVARCFTQRKRRAGLRPATLLARYPVARPPRAPLSAGSLIWSSISSRPPPTLFDGPLLTR
jgi:RadC-like JAB domain